MSPIFIPAILKRILGLERECLNCKQPQIVSSDKKDETVQCKYWSIEDKYWSPITSHDRTNRTRENQLENYTRYFIPTFPENVNPVGDSTKILIKDYSIEDAIIIETGWIALEKD